MQKEPHTRISVPSTGAAPSSATDTPLPTRLLIIPCMLLLTESICTTMLIPFVGYYVVFLQHWTVEDAGYASGILIALFMLGQVVTSTLWGKLSDQAGRKVCLVVGVSGCAASVFFFGLSGSVYSACLWRFLHGCFCGCTLITKTIVNDITDSSNKAKGFAALSLTWGVGILIGPSIGGMLYDPARSAPLAWMGLREDGFWGSHPAFLPCALVIVYNVVGVVLCVLYMKETNTHARPLTEVCPRCVSGPLRGLLEFVQPTLPRSTPVSHSATDVVVDAPMPSSAECPTEETATGVGTIDDALLSADSVDLTDKCVAVPVSVDAGDDDDGHTERSLPGVDASEPIQTPPSQVGYREAFGDPRLRLALTVFMLISTGDMLYAETLPLWAITPRASGGLELTAFALGVITLMNSFPAVAANVTFAAALRHVGESLVPFWSHTQLAYAVLTVLVPFAVYMSAGSAFVYTLVVNMVSKVFQTWMWASLMMVIAQCCTSQTSGAVYGIQQATASMVRCAVPFWGAPLYAWSVTGSRTSHVFHQGWLFIIAAIPLFVGAIFTRKLNL